MKTCLGQDVQKLSSMDMYFQVFSYLESLYTVLLGFLETSLNKHD